MTKTSGAGLFFKEFFRTFQTTGAISPSSRFLARALASPLKAASHGPRKILEAGPGSGSVTREMIPLLGASDSLTLCEINPVFYDFLKSRLETDPLWRAKREQIQLVNDDVRNLLFKGNYDLIVSGLPLNNFPPEMVREFTSHFVQSLKSDGVHTFFEYILVRETRMRLSSKTERQRMKAIHQAVHEVLRESDWRRIPILRNIPPAWAYRVTKKKSNQAE